MQPWRLDLQVLQADDCGRSASFRAALGFPYLLHQLSLGVSCSTDQQLQPWFPAVFLVDSCRAYGQLGVGLFPHQKEGGKNRLKNDIKNMHIFV